VKWIVNVLNGFVMAVLILMVGASAFLAFSARRSPEAIPTLAGHKVLMIVSGSMEPTIRTGDVILIRPLQPGQAIRDGDIITFRVRENPSMLITHRVVGTILVNGKPVAYTTKGDANPAGDTAPVVREQVVGIYRWRVPYFGYIATAVHKPAGALLFIILPGLLLIGLEVRKIWRTLAEEEAAKTNPDNEEGRSSSDSGSLS
jgi:signal peptidase